MGAKRMSRVSEMVGRRSPVRVAEMRFASLMRRCAVKAESSMASIRTPELMLSLVSSLMGRL